MTAIRKDSTQAAIVDHDYYWLPIATCPSGNRVQLLNRAGIAGVGKFTSNKDKWWVGWAPLPKIPDDIKELIK